jgi:CRP-like cAMP-binding protein/rhodanese-related sulfurtransferase
LTKAPRDVTIETMADKLEILKTLADSHLFGYLKPEILKAISEIGEEIVVPPDTTIGTKGEKGRPCCLIASGSVKMFRTGQSGAEVELFRLGPGESFGEVALLSDEPIPASVKTVEETRLILISRDRFDPIMREFPEAKEAVGKRVSEWFHRASSNIEGQAELRSMDFRLRWIDLAIMIGLSLLCALAFNHTNPKGIPPIPQPYSLEGVSFIDPSTVFEKQKKGEILIVDAIPAIFYEQEHIAGAVNVPLAIFDFMYDLKLGKTNKTREIVVYGRTISKHYDEEVASKLVVRGFQNVSILNDGISAWKKNHYPVGP